MLVDRTTSYSRRPISFESWNLFFRFNFWSNIQPHIKASTHQIYFNINLGSKPTRRQDTKANLIAESAAEVFDLPRATYYCVKGRGTRDWKRGKRVQLDRSYLHQWIWIQIGSVFSNFVEPDPYFEYGSGSTQVKKDRLKAKGWRLETKILPLGTQLNTKFPTALLVSCHCLLKKDVFSCETIFNSFSKLIP